MISTKNNSIPPRADMSKCTNAACPIRGNCYRWVTQAVGERQSFAKFEFETNEKGEVRCDHQRPIMDGHIPL